MPTIDELRRLAQLREDGVLSPDAFEVTRNAILEDIPEAEEAEPQSPAREGEALPLLTVVVLFALVLGCLGMLVFGLSLFTGAVIGVVALGLITLKLHSEIEDTR
ncbi:hypothetical protein [Actibacterium sp. 188UL27-1]|uniref:hypothetical protein n=1 Tax=Actibacterium sp. 188UL27-1 TaxID=2786961 RepID=UPI001957D47E|nr:hypothetical protein [Actibacterium sp. 188UL27-1]MBM7070098.1 hypothetical protein [Actibacterium sp. 188UL27-1]